MMLLFKNILEIDPEETIKLFKMTEVQISKCREYINNVNDTLKKVLSSWAIYAENIQLLKSWLEETRKDQPKKVFLFFFQLLKLFWKLWMHYKHHMDFNMIL